MNVTSLSFCHPLYFDFTAQYVATEEYKGTRIMRSCGISFVPSDVCRVALEIIPDGISAPIAEVTCCAYVILTRTTSHALKVSCNCLQAIFNVW